MKRFYTKVDVCELDDGGHAVMLDARHVRTPQRHLIRVSQEPLAQAIAQEWRDQKDQIVPDSMGLTQIVTTLLDEVGVRRAEMHSQIMKYLHTDLLFYRAPEPEMLVSKQRDLWDPLLENAKLAFGYDLLTTEGLGVVTQSDDYVRAMDAMISKMSDEVFTVFQIVVPLAGSLIIGALFVQKGSDVQVDDVIKAIRAEEDYKLEAYHLNEYGHDPQEQTRLDQMRADLKACARYLDFIS